MKISISEDFKSQSQLVGGGRVVADSRRHWWLRHTFRCGGKWGWGYIQTYSWLLTENSFRGLTQVRSILHNGEEQKGGVGKRGESRPAEGKLPHQETRMESMRYSHKWEWKAGRGLNNKEEQKRKMNFKKTVGVGGEAITNKEKEAPWTSQTKSTKVLFALNTFGESVLSSKNSKMLKAKQKTH